MLRRNGRFNTDEKFSRFPSRHFLQSPLLSVSPTLFFTNSPPHRFSPSHLLPISVSPTHPLTISPSPIQFSILFSIFVPSQTVLSRSFRGMRKVRATQGAMLPNGKAGVSLQQCNRKQPLLRASVLNSKGEKAG